MGREVSAQNSAVLLQNEALDDPDPPNPPKRTRMHRSDWRGSNDEEEKRETTPREGEGLQGGRGARGSRADVRRLHAVEGLEVKVGERRVDDVVSVCHGVGDSGGLGGVGRCGGREYGRGWGRRRRGTT